MTAVPWAIRDLSMLQFIARTIGVWFLAGAVVSGVVDGMKSIASTRLVLTSTGQFWALISPGTLGTAQGFVRRLSPNIWDQVATPALLAPLWGVLLLVGILFMVLGQRRRRDFLYAS